MLFNKSIKKKYLDNFIYAMASLVLIFFSFYFWKDTANSWEDNFYFYWAESKISLESALFYFFKEPMFLNMNLSLLHPLFIGASIFYKLFSYKVFIYFVIIFIFIILLQCADIIKKYIPFEFFLLSIPFLFQKGSELLIIWAGIFLYLFITQNPNLNTFLQKKKFFLLYVFLILLFSLFYMPLIGFLFIFEIKQNKNTKRIIQLFSTALFFLIISHYFFAKFLFFKYDNFYVYLKTFLTAYYQKDAVFKNDIFSKEIYFNYQYILFLVFTLIIYIYTTIFKVEKKNIFFLLSIELIPALIALIITKAQSGLFFYLLAFSFIPKSVLNIKQKIFTLSISALFVLYSLSKTENINYIHTNIKNPIVSLQDLKYFKFKNEAPLINILDIHIISQDITKIFLMQPENSADNYFFSKQTLDFLKTEEDYAYNIFNKLKKESTISFLLKTKIHPKDELKPYRRVRKWHEKLKEDGKEDKAVFFILK
ncbi:MAG: hypothetical protein OEZ22_05970 [Spirochaetia bacterium]|nr:hypothetical protein [Spirochaetia bacterium]